MTMTAMEEGLISAVSRYAVFREDRDGLSID